MSSGYVDHEFKRYVTNTLQKCEIPPHILSFIEDDVLSTFKRFDQDELCCTYYKHLNSLVVSVGNGKVLQEFYEKGFIIPFIIRVLSIKKGYVIHQLSENSISIRKS